MLLATAIGIISVEDIVVLPKEDDAGIGMYRKDERNAARSTPP
jgi:hypothetical protein